MLSLEGHANEFTLANMVVANLTVLWAMSCWWRTIPAMWRFSMEGQLWQQSALRRSIECTAKLAQPFR